jgi:hypothetical protein
MPSLPSRTFHLAFCFAVLGFAGRTQVGWAQAPDESTSAPAQPARPAPPAIELEVHGRVFAAATYENQRLEDQSRMRFPFDSLLLSVPSARASLRAAMLGFISVQIEAEIAGRVRLRDGFVQARKKRWMVRAGQFKMPISAFHMESPWVLPVARRGWLHELLSDHLLLTGRREGFMGRIEGGGFWDPTFTVGAFRSIKWGVDAGDPLEGLGPDQQTLVARLSTTPGGVELGAVGQRRVTLQSQGPTGYWAGGLDATGDLELEATGLRFWAEALAGQSWFTADPMRPGTPTFLEGRALVAFRWGGLERGAVYFEPFATAGMLEPDTSVTSDAFIEVMTGFNLGHWRSTRLTLQLEFTHAQRNFPRGFFFDFGRQFLFSHRAVVLQAGAAF